MIAAWVIIFQLAICSFPLTAAVILFLFLKKPCQKTDLVKTLLLKGGNIDLRGRNVVGKILEWLIGDYLILKAIFISESRNIFTRKMQPAEGIG